MNQRCTSAVVLALVVALGALGGEAAAQVKTEKDLGKTQFDPISLRAPNVTERFDEIYIEQKLNAQVPLDLKFRDESGAEVKLGDYFGEKPVVLALVYYECPMLCNLILNGMVTAFDATDNKLELGKDYTAIAVSIDPKETPELAAAKKANYLEAFHRGDGGATGWHFLTGDQDAIEDLAMAVGYRYYYDATTDQYAHASGIMIVTPQGKLSSYYLGMEYIPKNLQLAIMDAAQERIGPLVDQLKLLCYAYDPTKGAYGLYVMRLVQFGGTATVLAIVAFWVVSYRRSAKAARGGNGKLAAGGASGVSVNH